MSENQYPAHRASWTMVVLLTVAYILSYVDRSILGLLIEPIKANLHLSDESLGYLIGPAFALFYATIGLPLGWLADRKRRTWIVAVGIALWSIATAASGLTRSFGQLFVARMSVGVGEATLSPCAMSMIGDSFPPEARGKPVAVYTAALALGSGIASLIGAAVLTWAKTSSGIELPLFGAVKPWQFAFLVVGLPGLLLSLCFFLMAEPPRQPPAGDAALNRSGFGDMIGHVGRNWGAFFGLICLACVMTATAYSQGFIPSAFARKFGWEARDYALINGLMTLAIGPLTVTSIGALSDRWRKQGVTDAPFRLLTVGFVLIITCASSALIMPTPLTTFIMLGLATLGISTVSATGVIALLDITPPAIRGQTFGLYYMMLSAAGLGLGPTTVGLLSTRVFGEAYLNLAVGCVPLIFGCVPLVLLPKIRRLYLAQLNYK
jgi:MFS family permease